MGVEVPSEPCLQYQISTGVQHYIPGGHSDRKGRGGLCTGRGRYKCAECITDHVDWCVVHGVRMHVTLHFVVDEAPTIGDCIYPFLMCKLLQSKLKDALNELSKKALSTLTAHAAELPQHQYIHLSQHCYMYTYCAFYSLRTFMNSKHVKCFNACSVNQYRHAPSTSCTHAVLT